MRNSVTKFVLMLVTAMVFLVGICSAENHMTSAEFVLGEDNSFVELYGSIPVYSEDYELYLEDMVLTLADAFNSGRLGTRSAQAAIKGLVPEKVYKDKATNDDKMQAIYDYFCFDKLVNYFTLSFDRQGNPYKCELRVEGVKAYIEECISCGVFTGSLKSFQLDPSIGTFDEFCTKQNVTKEVAVAFFFVIQSYDINWVEGTPSVLLDELVFNQLTLEPKYQKAIGLKEAGEYEQAIKEFKTLKNYKDSAAQIKSCERAIKGIVSVTVKVTADSVYMRDSDGNAIASLPKGASIEITGYDYSCGMFTATYGNKSGYVKGAGFSVSQDELYNYFR